MKKIINQKTEKPLTLFLSTLTDNNAKWLMMFLDTIKSDCEFSYINYGNLLSIDIHKDKQFVGKIEFCCDDNNLSVVFNYLKNGLTLQINSEQDLIKANEILGEQIKGFEQYNKEKQNNFANTKSIFDSIELNLKEKLKQHNLSCNIVGDYPATRMIEIKSSTQKILLRLNFDNEGYQLALILNDDTEIDYDAQKDFDRYVNDIVYHLDCAKH